MAFSNWTANEIKFAKKNVWQNVNNVCIFLKYYSTYPRHNSLFIHGHIPGRVLS